MYKRHIVGEIGEKIANKIDDARSGKCIVHAGGGGNYGKIE